MLEKISGYTVEEAKAYLIKNLESEVTHEAAMKIKEIETRYKEEADQKPGVYFPGHPALRRRPCRGSDSLCCASAQ